MYKKYLLFIISIITVLSCRQDSQKNASVKSQFDEIVNEKDRINFSDGVSIIPFGESTSFDDASIGNINYTNGYMTINLRGESYAIGHYTPDRQTKNVYNSPKGQHIVLNIDNEYIGEQFLRQFEFDIADGKHIISATLARSYGQTIKNGWANATLVATVRDKSVISVQIPKEPLFIYSSPNGSYSLKEGEYILLDFFLKNIDISPAGNKLLININGNEQEITRWQSYYITGLSSGKHTVKMSLVDNNNQLIAAPFNPVEKTITITD